MAKRKSLAAAFEAKPEPTPPAKPSIVKSDSESPPRKTGQQRSRVGKKLIGGYVDVDVSKQLRMLAVEQDTTNENLIKEALNDLFQKYGKSRIA